jgi:hypothetical protein
LLLLLALPLLVTYSPGERCKLLGATAIAIQSSDQKFRSKVYLCLQIWAVLFAVELVLGSTRRPFNLYFKVCLKALRIQIRI